MNSKPKTHAEFADELGISRTTLWRRLTSFGFKTKNGLVSPEEQLQIKKLLGYLSVKPTEILHHVKDGPE